jgi:hypothetical protein
MGVPFRPEVSGDDHGQEVRRSPAKECDEGHDEAGWQSWQGDGHTSHWEFWQGHVCRDHGVQEGQGVQHRWCTGQLGVPYTVYGRGVCMPRAAKMCGHTRCVNRVYGRTYCDEHTPTPWQGSAGRPHTRALRTMHKQVISEEPVCRDCRIARSTVAGHIIDRADGGADVRSNLKGQCDACNDRQRVERSRR